MENFSSADVVFVADMFLEDYGGGAERTTEALFETATYKTVKIKSNEITVSELMNSIYCRNNNMNQFENNV